MYKRLLALMVVFILALVGCSGGDEEEEEVVFEPNQFLDDDDFEELEKMKKDQERVFEDYIKSMDHVVDNIMTVDGDRDYYYTDILNKKTDEVLRLQLLYMDVHRGYMSYLYSKDVSTEILMTQNRLFNKYLKLYEGKRFTDREMQKSIVERNFRKYNIEEFDAIVKGENLSDFIKDYIKWEKGIAYDKWFKEEDNANYKGNLLENYDVVLKEIPVEEESGISTVVNSVKEAEEIMGVRNFSGIDKDKNIGELLSKLEDWKIEVEEVILREEHDWIKERGVRLLDNHTTYLKLLSKGEVFDAADERFFVDIQELEDKTSMYLLGEMLSNKAGSKSESDKDADEEEKEEKEEG